MEVWVDQSFDHIFEIKESCCCPSWWGVAAKRGVIFVRGSTICDSTSLEHGTSFIFCLDRKRRILESNYSYLCKWCCWIGAKNTLLCRLVKWRKGSPKFWFIANVHAWDQKRVLGIYKFSRFAKLGESWFYKMVVIWWFSIALLIHWLVEWVNPSHILRPGSLIIENHSTI